MRNPLLRKITIPSIKPKTRGPRSFTRQRSLDQNPKNTYISPSPANLEIPIHIREARRAPRINTRSVWFGHCRAVIAHRYKTRIKHRARGDASGVAVPAVCWCLSIMKIELLELVMRCVRTYTWGDRGIYYFPRARTLSKSPQRGKCCSFEAFELSASGELGTSEVCAARSVCNNTRMGNDPGGPR